MARAGFLQDRSEVQTAAVHEMLENGTHATIAEIAAAELSSPIIPVAPHVHSFGHRRPCHPQGGVQAPAAASH